MVDTGVTFLHGDCREVLSGLSAESVHCCVTSPPYWGLRDYGVEGQIGLEPTPEGHTAALVAVFREVWRVLRADGTLWLNYGDCYNAGTSATRRLSSQNDVGYWNAGGSMGDCRVNALGLPPKSLMGMPWRVAFALQNEGWILRSDIIWSKLNPMPESVTDRPTRAHEYLFLLAKAGRYYYDADAVREPHTGPKFTGKSGVNKADYEPNTQGWNGGGTIMRHREYNPAGRNRRTVWTIPTESTPEAHFATFPQALVTPCIQAGTSEWGVCSQCGAPYVRQVEKGELVGENGKKTNLVDPVKRDESLSAWSRPGGKVETVVPNAYRESRTVGWQPSCDCVAGIVPATVIDPFAGSGTVMKVATKLGRRSIGIDLNEEYLKIAARRNAQLGLMI